MLFWRSNPGKQLDQLHTHPVSYLVYSWCSPDADSGYRSAVGAGAHVMLRLPSSDATQVDADGGVNVVVTPVMRFELEHVSYPKSAKRWE